VDVPDPADLINVVVYRVGATPGFQPDPFHLSQTAGFVHLIRDVDYFGICQFLVTPIEVMEYFQFREEMLRKQQSHRSFVPEAALLGQFMAGDVGDNPHVKFTSALSALLDDTHEWELTFITGNLGNQIAYREGDDTITSHYKILAQLALLSRSELKEFKTRLRLTLEAVRENRFELPYRLAVPRNDCGFLLFPVPSELHEKARIALHNFSIASKYDLRVTRHIGLSAKRSGEYIDLEWMFVEEPWTEDPELDEMLSRDYPFRRTRERMMPRYHFDSDRLRHGIGESP
jgi:hypothetical protein